MKRWAATVFLVIASVTVACGRRVEQAPAKQSARATPAAEAPESGALDITFKSAPDPPIVGENIFDVRLMGGNSQPVTDAEVSVVLYMAAMPDMNMPEMQNTVLLTHEGDGRYRGTGNVTMAGVWDATVMVMRGEEHLGSRKFSVAASSREN